MATKTQQEELVSGQAAVWGCIFGYIDTMALRCAIKLGIPDIISSHGRPLSLTQISNSINHPSLDIDRLSRVMTILVRRGIFSVTPSESEGTLYGNNGASELLLANTEHKRLAPMTMIHSSEFLLSLWQQLDDCVKDGSDVFNKRFGMNAWSYLAANPEQGATWQECFTGYSKITMEALKDGYFRNGLQGIRSLVDVGGGNGIILSEIVREQPSIKGINYDFPNVVSAAPEYPGVTHVAGDALISVPSADAVLMKGLLHNWGDEDCIKILTNCRNAIPKETGKVIVIDMVRDPYGNDPFEHTRAGFDLFMMLFFGAKERAEGEWKSLIEEAGFSGYKIVKIPDLFSVIEAYP